MTTNERDFTEAKMDIPNPLVAELAETKELLRAALAENAKLKAEKLLVAAAFDALKAKGRFAPQSPRDWMDQKKEGGSA